MPDYALKKFNWQGMGLFARTNRNDVAGTGANHVVFKINSLFHPMDQFTVAELDNEGNTPGETSTLGQYYTAYVVTFYSIRLKLTNLDSAHVVWAGIHSNEYSAAFIASTDLNDTVPYVNRPYCKTVQLAPNGSSGSSKTLKWGYGIGKLAGLTSKDICIDPTFVANLGTTPTSPIASLYAVLSMCREDTAATAMNVAMECRVSMYCKLQQKKPNVVI